MKGLVENRLPYLLLTQIIGQVGHHNLGLGRDTIFRRATLLLGAGTRLGLLRSLSLVALVGDLSQRNGLTGDVGGLNVLSILLLRGLFIVSQTVEDCI
jgi:hypothetical protein